MSDESEDVCSEFGGSVCSTAETIDVPAAEGMVERQDSHPALTISDWKLESCNSLQNVRRLSDTWSAPMIASNWRPGQMRKSNFSVGDVAYIVCMPPQQVIAIPATTCLDGAPYYEVGSILRAAAQRCAGNTFSDSMYM